MSTAAPLPTAHATTHVPAGLTATDWAQIRSQLALEAIASLNEQAKLPRPPATPTATNQATPFFIIGSILLLFLPLACTGWPYGGREQQDLAGLKDLLGLPCIKERNG
ncbi:MAG: hypothetical protein IPL28_02550 [Chloroflexi bacterium]|nr:hypothetical protein [Chloroflexota bacterium]